MMMHLPWRSRASAPRAAALVAALLAASPTAPALAQAGQTSRPDSTATAAPTAPAAPTQAAALPPGAPVVDRVIAVVGTQPILLSDLIEQVNVKRAQGVQMPTDSAGQAAFARQVVNELVDEEVMVQRAKTEKVEVTDADVASSVDAQIKRVRGQFKTDEEYRTELKKAGFGTPEEYRRSLTEQARRSQLFQRGLEKLKTDGKLVPVSVSEEDVTEAFEKNRASLPKRPATVTFRQIVVAPHASAAAKAVARARAESLLVELRKGGDFELIAKRESMDPGSKDVGGDLGWNRRGQMVPEFDRMMFALPPGQISPVVETAFGYHIIKVDRVQPAEVKARHILIRPKIDSTDVERAKLEADSVAAAWRRGVSYDTLVAKHHDTREERSILQPFDRAQLPPSYATAFTGKKASEITDPFPIQDPQSGIPKYVVAQLLTATEGGDYTVADLRNTIREQLQQERSIRRLLDDLRKQTYVSIRLDDASALTASATQ
jgi:peptidyl-prolyl cis-trans isomerase SurA